MQLRKPTLMPEYIRFPPESLPRNSDRFFALLWQSGTGGLLKKALRTTRCQANLPDSLAVTNVSQSRLTPHLGFFSRPLAGSEQSRAKPAPCPQVAGFKPSTEPEGCSETAIVRLWSVFLGRLQIRRAVGAAHRFDMHGGEAVRAFLGHRGDNRCRLFSF